MSCASGRLNGCVPAAAIRWPLARAPSSAAVRSSRSEASASCGVSHTFVASSTIEASSSIFSSPGSSRPSTEMSRGSTAGASASVSLSRICTSSSSPSDQGALSPKCCSIQRRTLAASGRLRAPAAEGLEQLALGLGRERLGREPAGERDRLADLVEVGGAACATVDVLLEAVCVLGRERALKVVGHQLDELLATELFDVHAHACSRYESSAARTFARARCSNTR